MNIRSTSLMVVIGLLSCALCSCDTLREIADLMGSPDSGSDSAGSAGKATTVSSFVGSWEKHGEFAQINVACSQLYTCACPPDPTVYSKDCSLTVTPMVASHGTCAQGGSDPESCTNCIAPAPTSTCSCTLTCPRK